MLNWDGKAGDRERIISVVLLDERQPAPQIFSTYKRSGSIDTAHELYIGGLRLRPPHGMSNDRYRSHLVIRQFSRTHERCLSTIRAGNSGDLLVIGRDDNSIKATTLFRNGNRQSDHRHATKRLDVLTRNAFTTATRRDNGEPHDCNATRRAATTASCCPSVRPGCMGKLIASA